MDADEAAAALTELAAALDAEIKAIRKTGDQPASLAAAAAALHRLDTAIAAAAPAAVEQARRLAMRISYNVAADVYPGWEAGTPMPAAATLAAARALALSSQAYAEQLGHDPIKRGNAFWLNGALSLTANDRAGAHAEFMQAAASFEPAPEMRLMAQGYAIIAGGASGLDEILAQLTAMATEDATFLRDQLITARTIFTHGSATAP